MNRQQLQTQCNPDALEQFLQGTLGGSEAEVLELHLTQCESCAEQIQLAAQRDVSWQEAQNLLAADEYDSPEQVSAITSLLSGEQDSITKQQTADVLSREIRGWLDPTDDPQSLGRFAGYEIVGIVGHGGMGIVLKGFESSLNRYVAIKVLAPRLATNGNARKRFAREAQAAAAVRHDNVIAIHRVDDWHGLPFLVMPYVGGISLQKRIDTEGSLNIEQTLRVGVQIASGLAAAHAQGLVHRDIKPANILLEQGVERVTITDFGLARAADDASVTRTGVIAGTPQYMSPEQADARQIDARSDLFSLGSVLYAMATGRPPFRGDHSFEVLKRIVNEPARPMREIEASVPEWFEQLVARLHCKFPNDRFDSAEQVADLLEDCLAHVQQPTTTPLPEAVTNPVAEVVKSFGSRSANPASESLDDFRYPPIGKLIAAAAFGFSLIFAGVLIVLELNKGTLTIESSSDQEVPIRIMRGDKVVQQLSVTEDGVTTRLKAGKYIIEIVQGIDGYQLTGNQVTLNRGENWIAKITQSRDEASPLKNNVPFASQADVETREGLLDGSFVTIPLKLEWHPEEMMKRNVGRRYLTVLADGIIAHDTASNAIAKVQWGIAYDCRLESYEKAPDDGAGFWKARLFVPRKAIYSIGALWYKDTIRTMRIGDRHTPVPAPSLTQDDPQSEIEEAIADGHSLRLVNVEFEAQGESSGRAADKGAAHLKKSPNVVVVGGDEQTQKAVQKRVLQLIEEVTQQWGGPLQQKIRAGEHPPIKIVIQLQSTKGLGTIVGASTIVHHGTLPELLDTHLPTLIVRLVLNQRINFVLPEWLSNGIRTGMTEQDSGNQWATLRRVRDTKQLMPLQDLLKHSVATVGPNTPSGAKKRQADENFVAQSTAFCQFFVDLWGNEALVHFVISLQESEVAALEPLDIDSLTVLERKFHSWIQKKTLAKEAVSNTANPRGESQRSENDGAIASSLAPTLAEATKQFNEQSAEDRRILFDPPIPDLTEAELRDGFRIASQEYDQDGEHDIAKALAKIAETGRMPEGVGSNLVASGTVSRDENGEIENRQIVPGLIIQRDASSHRLVLLKSLSLRYRNDGTSSTKYGDQGGQVSKSLQNDIQGNWIVESLVDGFKPHDDELRPMRMKIDGDLMLVTVNSVIWESPIRLTWPKAGADVLSANAPQAIDLTFDPNGEPKGKPDLYQGVIQCDGDTLTICFAESFRPKRVIQGSNVYYLKCRREKARKNTDSDDSAVFPDGWKPGENPDALAAMKGWVVAWDVRAAQSIGGGKPGAILRMFPDGRIAAVYGVNAPLVKTRVSPKQVEKLVEELKQRGSRREIDKLFPIKNKHPMLAQDYAALQSNLETTAKELNIGDPLPYSLWDQTGNRVTVVDDGELYDLMNIEPQHPERVDPAIPAGIAGLSKDMQRQLLGFVYLATVGGNEALSECLSFASAELHEQDENTPIQLSMSHVHWLSRTRTGVEAMFHFTADSTKLSFPSGQILVSRAEGGRWKVKNAEYWRDAETCERWGEDVAMTELEGVWHLESAVDADGKARKITRPDHWTFRGNRLHFEFATAGHFACDVEVDPTAGTIRWLQDGKDRFSKADYKLEGNRLTINERPTQKKILLRGRAAKTRSEQTQPEKQSYDGKSATDRSDNAAQAPKSVPSTK
ncbi:protein kinase domain-containing protein [Neorhodopirellula pilleata]|uniref:non-specific serine/threonine protein kinase n=1 Tax=Neorhodopirellula pilleata TaxID=2714738 RepID=A0A5C6B0Z3_9BACT|nr:protein kinase [Neorhodopirellula pilleata]TWU04064.1 Serine/threonine-protein kinase PknB [Neorhodopirellula pilleata]